MPDENEEQNVARFRQKVCMYLMTSICICELASTKMQDFVFNGTYVQCFEGAIYACPQSNQTMCKFPCYLCTASRKGSGHVLSNHVAVNR